MSLHEDQQLKSAKALKSDGGLSEIKYHKLDITDSKSIQSFVEDLKKTHGEPGIDFVINNAGIAMDGFSMEYLPNFHVSYLPLVQTPISPKPLSGAITTPRWKHAMPSSPLSNHKAA